MLVGSSSRAGTRIRKVVGKVGGAYCIGLLLCKAGSSVASIKCCTASLLISNVCGGELFPIRLLSIGMAKLLVVSYVQDIISRDYSVLNSCCLRRPGRRREVSWGHPRPRQGTSPPAPPFPLYVWMSGRRS